MIDSPPLMAGTDQSCRNMWRKMLASVLHRKVTGTCATYLGTPHTARARSRFPLRRRHCRHSRGPTHLVAAAALPSSRPLPGYRWRHIGRRPSLASSARPLPGSLPCIGRSRARQTKSRAGQAPSRFGFTRGNLVQAVGRPMHPLGRRRRGCTALSCPLRLPRRHHQQRIVNLDANGVTLRHKHRASNRWRTIHLTGHEFIRRFLQHVLPKGLHKVRYYGLWHSTRREHAAQTRLLLLLQRRGSSELEAPSSPTIGDAADRPDNPTLPTEPLICPHCKHGHLIHIGRLYPKQPSGP
jgi:Putative transposase